MTRPASGVLAGRVRPAAASTFETLLVGNGPGRPLIEVVGLLVTTSTTASFSLCLDTAGGTTFNQDTALFWNHVVEATNTFVWQAPFPGSGIAVGPNGRLGFSSSAAGVFTCSAFALSSVMKKDEFYG